MTPDVLQLVLEHIVGNAGLGLEGELLVDLLHLVLEVQSLGHSNRNEV